MALTHTSQSKDTQITNRMPPNRLLQQYMFHMTTTTGVVHCRRVKNPSTAESERFRQWSLVPGSRKTTSPTKLYPSPSASLFTCCGCGLNE
ncbi:hypothetical protein AVEN_136702-1 [Araneus ventricosus]|uniref:Uncharacterized protein n=1 Tax=Araneus ventricosus TaxID=182803 RepID=A0A4Y2RDB0_ARAVE|nr:hypothetical protein AVEN_136702-1 [Araneus ventricosus]